MTFQGGGFCCMLYRNNAVLFNQIESLEFLHSSELELRSQIVPDSIHPHPYLSIESTLLKVT